MERVRTEAELLEKLEGGENIILIECKKTANVMARYLKEKGMLERVTNIFPAPKAAHLKSYQGIAVQQLKEMDTMPRGIYLLVGDRENRPMHVLTELKKRGVTQVVLVDYELFVEFSRRENPDLKFLCVGFTKCGTTSLNNAFRMNKEIKMPAGKETFYLHWRNSYDNAPQRFRKKYFSNISEGQLLGNVEPSYNTAARGVYECFDKDVKLIFMVREPASATFSHYNMMMRRPRRMEYVKYFKKYKKYSVEIFSDYIKDKIYTEKVDRFQYDKWIREYLEYFSRDQIKVVIFEELLRDTRRVMDEIQDFIGVENKLVYEELPHSNEGNSVSKGYLSAYINYRYYKSIRNTRENTELSFKEKKIHEFVSWAQKYTTVENKERPTPEQRAELQAFYAPSVKRLGELLGRDMEEIWYRKE